MQIGLEKLYKENDLDLELRNSLNFVIIAFVFGIFWATISTGPALTGLSKELGANNLIYGLLMAMPVLGGIFQLYASHLLEKNKQRKKMLITFGVIQRMLWIPVGLVPFVIPMETGMLRMWIVIVLVTLSSMSGAFLNVTFYSWIGDLIPLKIRGRYFAIRSLICTVSGLIAGLISAWLLDALPGFLGYTTVFIIAGMFGMADILSFIKVKDIPMQDVEYHDSMLNVIRSSLANKEFVRFITFWTVWGFSINLAAPFFNMYAISNLKMTFLEIILTGQVASSIVALFVITRWGRFLDRYGSKPVLFITCFVTALLPLVWLFASPKHFISVLIFNIIGGMVWGGTDITNQNMLISNTPKENRSMSIAIYFIVTSILGNALAYIVGGYFLDHMNYIASMFNILGNSMNEYQLLFIITTIIRLIAIFVFLPKISDESSVPLKTVYMKIKSHL